MIPEYEYRKTKCGNRFYAFDQEAKTMRMCFRKGRSIAQGYFPEPYQNPDEVAKWRGTTTLISEEEYQRVWAQVASKAEPAELNIWSLSKDLKYKYDRFVKECPHQVRNSHIALTWEKQFKRSLEKFSACLSAFDEQTDDLKAKPDQSQIFNNPQQP